MFAGCDAVCNSTGIRAADISTLLSFTHCVGKTGRGKKVCEGTEVRQRVCDFCWTPEIVEKHI